MNYRAVVFALLSAALFGVSTPAAKVLLGAVDPFVTPQQFPSPLCRRGEAATPTLSAMYSAVPPEPPHLSVRLGSSRP